MSQIYDDFRYLKDVILFNTYYSFLKKRELRKFKNIHTGERCFIVATGPSLKLSDIELLENEYTFAVNSCFKMFDKTKWRPTYYVISDPQFILDMGDELLKYNDEIKCGFCSEETHWNLPEINEYRNIRSYINLPQKGWMKFLSESFGCNHMTNNIEKGVICGHTVVFSALQIAEYMGFKEIYLIGTDCNYTGKLQYSSLTPHTHLNNPNAADNMIVDYLYVKRRFDKKKIKIYNATRGGKLEVFQRVELDNIIK